MKVAVLADIHGNSYALEAALNHAHREKVEHLLVLGDVVGYYYHPDRVLDLLHTWSHDLIRGNHEDLLLDIHEGKRNESDLRCKYGSGHRMALEKLTSTQLNYLTTAPVHKRVTIDGISFGLYHGSPWNHNQYLYPDTDTNTLQRCDEPGNNFVLIGHSHYAFAFHTANSMLINAGSVGQSRSMGGVANWALIDTSNKVFQLKATPYQTGKLLDEVHATDPDIAYLSDILTRNRN